MRSLPLVLLAVTATLCSAAQAQAQAQEARLVGVWEGDLIDVLGRFEDQTPMRLTLHADGRLEWRARGSPLPDGRWAVKDRRVTLKMEEPEKDVRLEDIQLDGDVLKARFITEGAAENCPPDRCATRTVVLRRAATARGASGPASNSDRAAHFTFDGFSLGDDYAAVMARPPFDEPCDNDPIDDGRRRFMVYGARPCRGLTFPEGTTVAFFLPLDRHPIERYSQPIVAFAWLGGSYFHERSDFPVRVGTPLPEGGAKGLSKVLGAKFKGAMTVGGADGKLQVTRFEGDLAVLDDGARIVGAVVGEMPADPANPQWRGLLRMWLRYTRD